MESQKTPASTEAEAPFVASQKIPAVLSEIERIRGTGSAETLLRFFKGWPVHEVREACVKRLMEEKESLNVYHYDPVAACVESMIDAMYFGDNFHEEPYERLLIWYLSMSAKYQTRAINFACSLLEKTDSSWARYPNIHGAIYGAVKRNPCWYWEAKMSEFLEQSFAHKNWTIRRRALELICLAEDASFFERVAELSRKEKQTQEKTEDYRKKKNIREYLTGGELRGFLEAAAYHLLLCKTEERSDIRKFEDEVAQTLQKIGKLGVEPHVEFSCPEQVPAEMGFSIALTVLPQSFVIDSEGSHFRIHEGASLSVLARCGLWLKVDGAKISNGDGVEPILHRRSESSTFFSQKDGKDTARFTILPGNRKVVRLMATFVYQQDVDETWKEVAKLTRYIRRAE